MGVNRARSNVQTPKDRADAAIVYIAERRD